MAAGGDQGFSDDGETAASLDQGVGVQPPVAPTSVLKPAAVLILMVNRAHGPQVLFTQRTPHLTDHGGQISFPGGRVEADDRDAIHTALRETLEETGVPMERIETLGALPNYTTGTGYHITPVVGWIEPPIDYRPDPKEVSECFEVPLDFLIDPRNHRLESAMYRGRMRSYYAVPYQRHYIWGATAGMLVTLTRVIAAARGESSEPPVRMSPDPALQPKR
jgi:8-oxo-dGTP pyrophosphatase MutT (NUDIX family)